jgi:uncharacterized protein YfiM (DUF2279 family)
MAMTLIAKPEVVSPAFNILKFIYDSTNKNNTGFRYLFDIYPAGSGTRIGRYPVLPENVNGYGEIDLSMLLRSKVTSTVNFTSNNAINAAGSYYAYDVKVGEMYVTEVSYTSSVTQNGTYVKITATHAFVVGDRVVIAQADSGTANPGLEGLFTVTAVTGTSDFTVNSLWADVTDATINGTVKYSDNRKTITTDIITSTNNYVFNGVIDWIPFTTYDDTSYLLNSSNDYLLTGMPLTGFKATLNQSVWINFMNNSVATGYAYFQNSTGDIFRTAINTSTLISRVGVGPYNLPTLSLVSGSGSLVESDVEYYDFWYANSAGTQHSRKYRIEIDRRCEISEIEILFKDRLGSWGSFSFGLRNYEKGTVTKQSFNKQITGAVAATQWNHATYERGVTVFDSKVMKTLELNTNWMSVAMSVYFEQLMTSRETFIKIDSSWLPCEIITSEYDVDNDKNKHQVIKNITVKLPYNGVN